MNQMFNNAILPYTFTTGELEQLKTKLLSADNQMTAAKQQNGMLSMSISEIRTLLRMIDMTYLQGLSSSQNVLPTLSTPEIPQANNMMGSSSMGGMNSRNSNPRQPPPNYLCYNCRVPGHFINDCPQRQQTKKQQKPPANYVCHKCNIGGHWIHDCPYNATGNTSNNGGQQKKTDYSQPPPANYVCHRCHVPGHWIKNCPTNNDPSYEPNMQQNRPQNGNGQNRQQGMSGLGQQMQNGQGGQVPQNNNSGGNGGNMNINGVNQQQQQQASQVPKQGGGVGGMGNIGNGGGGAGGNNVNVDGKNQPMQQLQQSGNNSGEFANTTKPTKILTKKIIQKPVQKQ